MSAPAATTFWRVAGLSYLEFAAKATTVLRSSLAEPVRAKALARDGVNYNRNIFVDGVGEGKSPVTSLEESSQNS
ncbi:unnamed protein product [Chrysoparadoxa australica]